MPRKRSFMQYLKARLANPTFFRVILFLLVVQAAWIALSGRFPMAFDEDFHFGIIRLYAHHLSPFWHGQPVGADTYGAVARDPSYLYHWLMSFPYRVVSVFTANQVAHVLVLRALNIGIFAWGLTIWRKVLAKSGASNAVIHTVLLVFILIPVVPLLAAQINYDNLFIPAVGVALLLTINFAEELKRYKRTNMRLLGALLMTCLLASLIKYAFLPIFLALAIYIGVLLVRTYPHKHKLWLSFGFGLTLIERRLRLVLLVGLLVATGLFVQRYGVNMVQYHKPIPDCSQVLDAQRCRAYGPWLRDYDLSHGSAVASHVYGGLGDYTREWLYGMWVRLFFSVDGPGSGFETRGPLRPPAIGSLTLAITGFVLFVRCAPRVFRRYRSDVLWLGFIVAGAYVATLAVDGYQAFNRTGQPVALNGRYLLPILLPLLLIIALSFNEFLRGHDRLKVATVSAAVICLLWGGGALTYVLRSTDYWYWPSPIVRQANWYVRETIGRFTPGYHTPVQFLH